MILTLFPRLKITGRARHISLPTVVLFLLGFLLWMVKFPNLDAQFPPPLLNATKAVILSSTVISDSDTTALGVAQNMYILSLPARIDRRAQMEILRKALGLHWTYVDALPGTNELTQRIWEWVMRVRDGKPIILNPSDNSHDRPSLGQVRFSWPDHIDQLAVSLSPIDFWAHTVWSTPILVHNPTPYRPTGCAMDDYRILNFSVELPEHLILTRARIACWYSHVSVLHKIANNKDQNLDSTYIILEDDIDMEKDIRQRLANLWKSLPPDWDMVFLGHCWSNEETHPPLPNAYSQAFSEGKNSSFAKPVRTVHRLHPSFKPKCTHAYAISKGGARRLLLHLRYPPFAYSRAIDQAIAWLIEKGRIKSYTVIPSLVIQTKADLSDIAPGNGNDWGAQLVDGVLGGRLSSVAG